MLEIYEIEKSYNGKKILGGISLAVKRCETVSILGLKETGKTTLLNIISGQEIPDKGSIFLDGTDITGKTGFVGHMPQSALLTPDKTIENGLSLSFKLSNQNQDIIDLNIKKELSDFGLGDTANLYPYQLSEGVRRRILLLGTYIIGKKVSLLDEPFSNLDVPTKNDAIKWYVKLSEAKNSSTIVVTHDIDEALAISSRIFIMNGVPAQIINEFNIFHNVDKAKVKGQVVTEFKHAIRHRLTKIT